MKFLPCCQLPGLTDSGRACDVTVCCLVFASCLVCLFCSWHCVITFYTRMLNVCLQVLELVGTTTLEDSLKCANQSGIVCMTGMVGNKWALDSFSPMECIPEAVYLTKYSGMVFMSLSCESQLLVESTRPIAGACS